MYPPPPPLRMFRQVFLTPSVFALLFFNFFLESGVDAVAVKRAVPDSPFSVAIEADDATKVRDWLKNDAQTKIVIRPEFTDDARKALDLPVDANECREEKKKDAKKDDDVDECPTRSSRALFIFDWCRWEWNLEGNYGIWDEDFRYETYSMKIVTFPVAEIALTLDLNEEDGVDASSSNETREYFSRCLGIAEKIEEIGRAMKWLIDDEFYAKRDEHHRRLRRYRKAKPFVYDVEYDDDDVAPHQLAKMRGHEKRLANNIPRNIPPGKNNNNDDVPVENSEEGKTRTNETLLRDDEGDSRQVSNRSICQKSTRKRNLSSELEEKSNLCFKALRHADPNRTVYLETETSNLIQGDAYRLVDVCIRGSARLEDLRVSADRERTDLTQATMVFNYVILFLLTFFMPFCLKKIIPLGKEDETTHSQINVNVAKEEVKRALRKQKTKAQAPRKWQPSKETKTKNDVAVTERRYAMVPITNICDAVVEMEKEATVVVEMEKEATVVVEMESEEAVVEMKNGAKKWEVEDCDAGEKMSNDSRCGCCPLPSRICERCTCMVADITANVMVKWNGVPISMGHADEDVVEWPASISQKNYNYVALDRHVPKMTGLKSLMTKKIDLKFGEMDVGPALTCVRSFLYLLVSSIFGIVGMAILDHLLHKNDISKLLCFKDEFNVEVSDLKYWNYFSYRRSVNRWQNRPIASSILYDVLFVAAFVVWCGSLFILSIPSVTKYFIWQITPTPYVGFYRLIKSPAHLEHQKGMERLSGEVKNRMSHIFKTSFWSQFLKQVVEDPVEGKFPKIQKIAKGFASLLCLFSFNPIFALCPPLYSWHEDYWHDDYWPRNDVRQKIKIVATYVGIGLSCAAGMFVTYLTFSIFTNFVIFTTTALLYHHQYTSRIIVVVFGIVSFVLSIRFQFVDNYIKDKLLILEVIEEIQDEKIEKIELSGNEGCYVPKLLWWWSRESWPCIPRKLYKKLIKVLHPVGAERLKVFVKCVLMGLFLGYMYKVMKVLDLSEKESILNLAEVAFAVLVPSLIVRFKSEPMEAMKQIHKKGILKENVEQFLDDDEAEDARRVGYYDHDSAYKFEIISDDDDSGKSERRRRAGVC